MARSHVQFGVLTCDLVSVFDITWWRVSVDWLGDGTVETT